MACRSEVWASAEQRAGSRADRTTHGVPSLVSHWHKLSGHLSSSNKLTFHLMDTDSNGLICFATKASGLVFLHFLCT